MCGSASTCGGSRSAARPRSRNGLTRLVFGLAIVATCAAAGTAAQTRPDSDLEQLAKWLVGTFDTSKQAEADATAALAYVHDRVRLKVAGPVSMPSVAGDGLLLYVEQAQFATLEKPYRQRLYRLVVREQHPVLEVWRIKTPLRFVGGADNPATLAPLSPADVSHETGCDVVFTREGDRFRGAIQGKTCASTWNGSTYVISEMTVTAAGQDTLDRGFDAADRQTFGPRNGEAYQFRRIER